MAPCVMSIFGANPKRIGGLEMLSREMAVQLAAAGWKSVACFHYPPPESVRRFLEEPGTVIEVLPNTSAINWSTISHVARLLRQYRPAVLYLNLVRLVSFYPWLARCCSVRHVFIADETSRPEGYAGNRSASWKRAASQALNWPTDGVVAASDCIARFDEAFGLVRDGRLSRIYNGIDLTRPLGDGSVFRAKYRIPEDRAIVLGVSWMIPEKGIEDLLDAARLVLAVNPDVHFVMVGEGPSRARFMEYAEQSGIADHVTWAGLVEDPMGDGVYSIADVVCQLSRWQEAFGFVIAEAMAHSKPVVATNVGGIPEVVQDGATGFVVARRDPGAAAEKILYLLENARLRRRMGEEGRARVEQLFDLKRTVAELIALFGVPGQASRVRSSSNPGAEALKTVSTIPGSG